MRKRAEFLSALLRSIEDRQQAPTQAIKDITMETLNLWLFLWTSSYKWEAITNG